MENDSSGTPQWTSWAPVSGTGVGEWFRYYVNSQNTARLGSSGLRSLQVPPGGGLEQPVCSMRSPWVLVRKTEFTNLPASPTLEWRPRHLSGFSGPQYNGSNLTYTQDCVYHAWQYNSFRKVTVRPQQCGGYAIDSCRRTLSTAPSSPTTSSTSVAPPTSLKALLPPTTRARATAQQAARRTETRVRLSAPAPVHPTSVGRPHRVELGARRHGRPAAPTASRPPTPASRTIWPQRTTAVAAPTPGRWESCSTRPAPL